ncbi:MAG: type II secretion system GspH family protein [Desulfobulbaceae bacterium]|nr:type II secretion system GspH family protein [Desulfobulbaceae bacterium]
MTPNVGGSCRGFTLIELVVVMVLLSIMTAFAVPAIRTALFSDQLKSTARRLIGLINETGQTARSDQQEYFLVFDPQARAFQVQTANGKEEKRILKPVPLPDGVEVVDFTSVHGGTESQGKLSLRFSKKGYVDKTLIHIRAEDGRELTLALSPFLGVSRLYDSYRTLEDDDLQW